MKKDNQILLQHILASIERIEKYTKNITEQDFLNNLTVQDAVLRRLEIIGEACAKLSPDFRDQHSQVEWHKPIAIRNILIHQYFEVDLKIIWDTVKINLPDFKPKLSQLLH